MCLWQLFREYHRGIVSTLCTSGEYHRGIVSALHVSVTAVWRVSQRRSKCTVYVRDSCLERDFKTPSTSDSEKLEPSFNMNLIKMVPNTCWALVTFILSPLLLFSVCVVTMEIDPFQPSPTGNIPWYQAPGYLSWPRRTQEVDADGWQRQSHQGESFGHLLCLLSSPSSSIIFSVFCLLLCLLSSPLSSLISFVFCHLLFLPSSHVSSAISFVFCHPLRLLSSPLSSVISFVFRHLICLLSSPSSSNRASHIFRETEIYFVLGLLRDLLIDLLRYLLGLAQCLCRVTLLNSCKLALYCNIANTVLKYRVPSKLSKTILTSIKL